jgi:hypothetical protein
MGRTFFVSRFATLTRDFALPSFVHRPETLASAFFVLIASAALLAAATLIASGVLIIIRHKILHLF